MRDQGNPPRPALRRLERRQEPVTPDSLSCCRQRTRACVQIKVASDVNAANKDVIPPDVRTAQRYNRSEAVGFYSQEPDELPGVTQKV